MVGSSCLFLAAKIDESNVTCDAVINAIQTLLTPTQFSVFGKDPKVGYLYLCGWLISEVYKLAVLGIFKK